MTAAGALILYPSWAIAVLLVATAARLGRATGRGLLVVCSLLAMWITIVILVELPATRGLAEHLLALGMLQAGGYTQAGFDIVGRRSRLVWLGYGWGAAIAVLGAVWPRGLYGPGMVGPGPVFWPITATAGAGAIAVAVWLIREARRRDGMARRQMIMLAVGNAFAAAAGGGALLLRIVGIVHDLRLTAPASLAAVIVIGGAMVRGEVGLPRRMIVQTFAYAALAAVITALGILALTLGLPALAPGPAIGWTLFVVAAAALPLDAVRTLIVDGVGRRVFAAPIGVRDLAEQAERHEVRADHAGRLAELGALVSAVAHEVRNPLGVIAAHAKLLERAGAPAASVDAVRAQVRRASRFVDDLLAYGKPRPLALRELDLRAVVDEAITAVQAVHPGVVARATPDPAESAPGGEPGGVPGGVPGGTPGGVPGVVIDLAITPAAHVVGDRAALVDVLVNLIGNAVIAVGDRGRIAITAADAADAPGLIELAITDDGPGVPAALGERLFQPFVTGRGRDHAHPGTGLGLAIARSIAERHGGSLRHAAVVEGGARFVLRLPRG